MMKPCRSAHACLPAIVCAMALFWHNIAAADTRQEVDVQLVLAADASGSMGRSLALAQREGFAAAFRDPTLWNAVLSGPLGRIAVTYFEWSGEETQKVVIPWRLVDDAADMIAIAEELDVAEIPAPKGPTSISGAIRFAHRQFGQSAFRSHRKVIDVSGDGPNNAGPSTLSANERTRVEGVTVNGLVMHGISEEEAGPYWFLFEREQNDTVEFFRREVRYGPGSFVMEVEDEADFAKAILKKLVLEIAWLE